MIERGGIISTIMCEIRKYAAVSASAVVFSLFCTLTTGAADSSFVKAKLDERIIVSVTGCFAGYEMLDALRKASELGFQSVAVMPQGPAKHSLGELPTLQFYNADDNQRQRIRDAISKFKHVSIHQSWDQQWYKWIDCADFIGAEIVTIHAANRKPSETQEQFKERWVKFIRPIADYAQGKGVKIGVENAGGKYGDYVSLLQAMKHPAIGATIDIGHCAYFDEVQSITNMDERVKRLNDTICQLVRELNAQVYHFHIHNVKRYEAVDFSRIPNPRYKPGSLIDHRLVSGGGEIDFPRFFAVLKEIHCSGMFELELEEVDKEDSAVRSARYLSELMQQ